MHRSKLSVFRFWTTPLVLLSIFLALFGTPSPAYAAGLDVQPLAWNIIGLDSNKPSDGPNHFPVGVRVCNNSGQAVSNVTATLRWDSVNPYIGFRPGTSGTVTRFTSPDSLGVGACADFYFEVEVEKNSAAYDTTRRYHVDVTAIDAATGVTNFSGSTPAPRELYVEHLVSQSRNAVTDVQYGTSEASLASVPAGGTMALMVGQTYFIRLVGFTATQGYNQLESFINFPNTIFQVLSVKSVYSAPSAGYIIDKMYSDACGWDNVVSSPTYRSCIVSDDKAGGNIEVTYEVKIIKVPDSSTSPVVNPEPLSTLIYDFSGSSYHYNADFGISARYAYIVDATAIDISKSFSPATISPGSTSTLTFTVKNNATASVAGVNFTDTLPTLTVGTKTGQMVADPATYTSSGCGLTSGMNFATGDTVLSFSNGAIASNGTCTISVSVSVPSDPTSGNYHNESSTVKVGDADSGHKAAADLTIDPAASTPGTGICGVQMAYWDMGTVAAASPPAPVLGTNVSIAGAQFFGAAGATSSVVTTDPSDLVGPPASSGGGSWQSNGYPKNTAPVLGMDSSLEFRVDSSQYRDVTLQLDDYGSASFVNANYLYVWSSTDGSTWQPVSSGVDPILKTTWKRSTAFPASDTGTNAMTYFRVSAIGANNTSGTIQVDDVRITGCGNPSQPALSKAFSPNPVVVGGTSILTFTLTNTNSDNLTGAKFTDTLPAGLEYDITTTPTTTCSGTPSMGFTGNNVFDFGKTTSGTIPPGGCTVTVKVKATTAGPHQNISDFIYTAEGGTNSDPEGSAKASLVAVLPPAIDKSFNPSTVLAGETSTLTFILTNPNPSDALTNVAFSDTLPTGMTLASDVITPQCGGAVTGAAGSGAVGFSGGTIPAGGNCSIAVTVTASGLGDYNNTSDPVTVTIGGLTTGTDTASATLTVKAPNPAISILKRVSTSASGPWYPFLTVAPGTPVYYQFTVENTGDVDFDNVTVSDPTLTALGLDLSGCAWATLARYTDAVSCVTPSTAAQSGSNPNTAIAQGTYMSGGETKTASSSALYTGVDSGEFGLLKQISTKPTGPWSSSITALDPGSTVYYKFTVVNATGGLLTSLNVTDVDPAVDTTSCAFTDPLPDGSATTCIVSAAVSTTDMSTHTNTATAHGTDGTSTVIDSPSSSAEYTPKAPDLTVTKSNNTSGIGKVGTNFDWTISVENTGTDTATFADGQTVLSDLLPGGANYNPIIIMGGTLFTQLDCTIDISNRLLCVAKDGAVVLSPGDSFNATISVTPTAAGDLQNTATVDPTPPAGGNINESDEGNNSSTDTVTILAPPSIAKSFLNNPIAVGGTSTLRFTITNSNTTAALTGVAFSDTLPTGMTLAADTTTPQCGGTVTGALDGSVIALSGGSVAANSSCTLDVIVKVAVGGDYVNTSDAVSSTNVGTGNTASDTLKVFDAVKSIVATSETSTTVQGSYERVAVGEIIRYRLTTSLPEGTWNNFQIVDAIDTGIQFLDGATVSFDCDGTCSHSIFTITPDPTADPYPYGSSTDPTFDLGTVTNPDADPDPEYLIVEFNALVRNMPGNNSSPTASTRTNTYTVLIDGSSIATSKSVGVRVAEPSINDLTKMVLPATGPYVLGDTITYTLKYSNSSSGVGRGTAFDVSLTDTLDATYLDLQSVNVSAPAGVTVTDTSTSGVGGEVRFSLDALPPVEDIPGVIKDVTVTVTAKIAGSPTNGQVISNTAGLTYTSLPGGITTGDSNGTCPNPTGSCTPGTSGSLTGERNGDGTDANDHRDAATVDITITVVETNVPPVANDDSASTPLNTPMTFSATGNDTDSDGTVNAATVDLDPSTPGQQTTYTVPGEGTFTVDGSGNVTFTPAVNFTGTSTIPYTVQDDDSATSNQANLSVTVTNLLPQANPDTNTATENGPAVTGNLLTNETSLGDTPTTMTAADQGGNAITLGSAFTTAAGGSLTLNADGTYSYTPPTWDNVPPAGLTETFNYTIEDTNGDQSSTTLTITIADDDRLPQANPDTNDAVENGPAVTGNVRDGGVAAGDNPDTLGDEPTTVTAADQDGSVITIGSAFTTTAGGSLTLNIGGSYSYTPPTTLPEGAVLIEVFNYTITDNDGDFSASTLTISVDRLPQAGNDSASTLMNTLVTTPDVLANDDQGDTPAAITAFDATSANGGVITDNGDGTFDYDPPTGFTGMDTFTYTITDSDGDISTATVTITVLTNNPPTATDNESTVNNTTTVHIANMVTDDEGNGVDNDLDGHSLVVIEVDGETNPLIDLIGMYGTLDWATDGSYTYTLETSDPDYLLLAGGATVTETFPYTISDGYGSTDTANIIITVTGTDDVPEANDDSFTTLEDTSLTGDLKPDNGSGADIPSGDGGNVWSVVDNPNHGTVTVNPDGSFTYTPDANYHGPDSFTYQICDVDNDCDQATVNLTVSSVEDPAIGIAKRVASITRAGSGTFNVTLEFHLQNYGDVFLSNVQVTDDLSVTFPAPTTFTVQSVTVSGLTNASLTANPGYNGITDQNLLAASGNSLAVNGSGTITVVVIVLPASSGPFFNLAAAQGETPAGRTVSDDSSDGTDPDNTASCPTCVNGDGDPTNNAKQTDIHFDPDIFDPPFGFKELDPSGLPVLRWTMIWINDNNFPAVAAVSDPIPTGSTYEATGASSGFPVPSGAPAGSTNAGLSCTTDSAAEPAPDAESSTSLCYYEGPTGAYPRGRIVWEGVLGPDLGATNQGNANDEVYITFAVRVATAVTSVQNVASIDADLNNDADLTDPGEQIVATAQAGWQEPLTPVDGREGKKLPATGFAPGKITPLPEQKPEQAFAALDDLWLEIPSLGVKTPVVGVPKNAGVWDVDWLWGQTGWLQGTAFPTWVGNSVLTAHVYLPNGKPGPFVDLGKLRYGDQVIVHAFGERYVYEVRTNHVILPTDMSPFKHEEKAWLTLLTCKSYDESTDTYRYRLEARAVLIKVEAE